MVFAHINHIAHHNFAVSDRIHILGNIGIPAHGAAVMAVNPALACLQKFRGAFPCQLLGIRDDVPVFQLLDEVQSFCDFFFGVLKRIVLNPIPAVFTLEIINHEMHLYIIRTGKGIVGSILISREFLPRLIQLVQGSGYLCPYLIIGCLVPYKTAARIGDREGLQGSVHRIKGLVGIIIIRQVNDIGNLVQLIKGISVG